MAFSRKAAQKLDDTAAALYRAAGPTGDAIANAVIAPVRTRISNDDCTRCARGKCKNH